MAEQVEQFEFRRDLLNEDPVSPVDVAALAEMERKLAGLRAEVRGLLDVVDGQLRSVRARIRAGGGPLHRKRKYPWPLWMDGCIWKLQRGVDFDVPVPFMQSLAHITAKRHRCGLKTAADGDFLVLKFTKETRHAIQD